MKKFTLTALSIATILLSPTIASANPHRDWDGYSDRKIIILDSRDRNYERSNYDNRNYNRYGYNENRNDYGRRRYYDDRAYRRYDYQSERNYSDRPFFGINLRFGQ
jgi:hypothetical protein